MGNAPPYLPNLRGWAGYGEDLSLIKRTPIKVTEGAFFELRMGAINLFNRIALCNATEEGSYVSDSSTFGQIFGKCGGPRTIQMGIRISF
jgi:hypothetical protein